VTSVYVVLTGKCLIVGQEMHLSRAKLSLGFARFQSTPAPAVDLFSSSASEEQPTVESRAISELLNEKFSRVGGTASCMYLLVAFLFNIVSSHVGGSLLYAALTLCVPFLYY